MLLPLLLLPIFAGLFWFVVVVPQRRIQDAHAAVVASLAVDQRVVTAAGLHGLVVGLGDETVDLQIAPGVTVVIDRQAVALVIAGDGDHEQMDRSGEQQPGEQSGEHAGRSAS